jgi:hypothetical protein
MSGRELAANLRPVGEVWERVSEVWERVSDVWRR